MMRTQGYHETSHACSHGIEIRNRLEDALGSGRRSCGANLFTDEGRQSGLVGIVNGRTRHFSDCKVYEDGSMLWTQLDWTQLD